MFWFEKDRFIHKITILQVVGGSVSQEYTQFYYIDGMTCQGRALVKTD